ncbi:hypothetical protein NEOLEDRAFT_1158880 [Neolentinus lepideus HHB14362 ss-1]|uniref:Uncharacterized protein n=1 Tax=Neolentinus lepideus HHB14362 ss-1 TaxID=1314782 RepID=A0A165NPN6_9AGAM|nr:hypothetical protein NEOLEDRAFT_1158880 [Neolentinus lepideus HHB14362 ss-1]
MFPTIARLSKASRRPLTPKRGNKDFYKGTRQAYLPGAHRTGAPGKFVIRGKAKYRLVDEQVRVFVAPPIGELNSTKLKPYVDSTIKLSTAQRKEIYGKFSKEGFDGRRYLEIAEKLGVLEGTAVKV